MYGSSASRMTGCIVYMSLESASTQKPLQQLLLSVSIEHNSANMAGAAWAR